MGLKKVECPMCDEEDDRIECYLCANTGYLDMETYKEWKAAQEKEDEEWLRSSH